MNQKNNIILILALAMITATLVCADGSVISCPDAAVTPVEGEEETDESLLIEIEEGEEETHEEEVTEEETHEEETEEVEEEATEEEDMETEVEIVEEETEVEEVVEEIEMEGSVADIVVVEGELVELATEASDPDGDELTLTYSEPIAEDGTWQTEIGDAGDYEVTVTASDGTEEISQVVMIKVFPQNAVPVIEIADEFTFNEGDVVVLEPEVTDEDDDEVAVSFSGWMDSESYETTFDDAGEYVVTITATDGKVEASKEVTIIVENMNRKPSLKISGMEDGKIYVVEGEEVLIEYVTEDEDGDEIEVSFSEPFTDGSWQTEVGNAGEYVIEVIATDGEVEASQEVLVVVEKLNAAPTLEALEDIYVSIPVGETKTIELSPVAEDAEGEVTLSYSGWMEESTKEIAWGVEGGEHTVTVTATDSEGESVSVDVKVTVNSAPCFIGDCPA